MLTRVYIDNFRSFVNFEYRPEQKQLLLGPNGSGKSSLLEAIRYLKEFVKGDSCRFTQSTRTRWQDRPQQVFELELLLDEEVLEYRLEIGYSFVTKAHTVDLERLKVDGDTVFELSAGQIRFFQTGGSTAVPFKTDRSALHLAVLSTIEVRKFVDWLDRVHCFSIDAYPGKMDESADTDERDPDFEIENLAGWYGYNLKTYPDENSAFIAALRESMEGFHILKFPPDEHGVRNLTAEFISTGGKKVSYSLSELSTGQRYLIGLYMILHFAVSLGHTVFIDEPDNFISLREIQPWLLAAEEAVENANGQLILISHNPETLNYWAREYGLYFSREENGHVRTEKFHAGQYAMLQPAEIVARGWEQEQ